MYEIERCKRILIWGRFIMNSIFGKYFLFMFIKIVLVIILFGIDFEFVINGCKLFL